MAGGAEDEIVADPEPDIPSNSKDRDCSDVLSSQRGCSDVLSSQRVFKKCSPNNKLTLYLGSRDIVISQKNVGKIHGVVIVEPDFLQNRKIFGQVTLTFRYGREDEEVMGLKFCNEAIMCLAQLHPPHERAQQEPKTPLQEALLRRLGPNAHAFTMEVNRLAPPSVQLVPAKEYSGAPIGTSYDVRAYVADRADEKLHRRSTVRMSIRVVQQVCPDRPYDVPAPRAAADKPFLLSDGRLVLEASLDRAIYCHGDTVLVNIHLTNTTNKTVRRIKVFIVQHVDVCMFSNGKFKNVVALINSKEECPLGPGTTLNKTYSLNPAKGATKNWIALEDSYSKSNASLASTVTCNSPEERNVFAIYVSYYVKVKLLVGAIGGELSLKLPFTLMHSQLDLDSTGGVPLPEPVSLTPTKTSANTTTDIDVIRELSEEMDI
ncbi:arrestin homolog isoform X2 [Macrosteles quadrilineatus]|uniref:arrestin homolog isoform X2 n=1 Tax=Macrosteles quadrilineatus TaxID=74068 RepID=UPI0023E1AAC5|nr:arrestin homolog isoform X2 [Macrosteles quadrilineatus]